MHASQKANAPITATGGTTPKILIIVPCFNEDHAIPELLRQIAAAGFQHSLVVDDGSADRTYEVARKQSATVRLMINLGIGGAVQTGIKYAARNGYDLCAQIDGDGQHPPEEIRHLLDAYERSHCNIVIGSRYLRNDSFRSTFSRRIGTRMIAWTLRSLFSCQHITDPTSGMRLMDRKAIELFASRYPQDFPEPISLAWALRAGLTVDEVPVQMRPRQGGTSSLIGLKPLAYMVRVISYIALARISHTS